jgi:hypothetical protein
MLATMQSKGMPKKGQGLSGCNFGRIVIPTQRACSARHRLPVVHFPNFGPIECFPGTSRVFAMAGSRLSLEVRRATLPEEPGRAPTQPFQEVNHFRVNFRARSESKGEASDPLYNHIIESPEYGGQRSDFQ